MNQQRLVTMPELIELVPFSRGHVYRLIREGKFPAPIKLGDRRVAWLEHELEHWISARIAERDARTTKPEEAEAR